MIRFALFGVPIAVRPSFWLVALLLGFNGAVPAARLAPFLAAWVLIVFVSVLAHELGHALVARRWGARVSVTLFALGGFTSWEAERMLSPLRRVGVAAAGSVVGFVLGGLTWLLVRTGAVAVDSPFARLAVGLFITVNLFWGLLNWLPIRPLDGGHIFTGLLQAALGRVGERIADVLFPLATLGAGLWAWREGLLFAALLAGFVLVDEARRWTERRAPTSGPSVGAEPESSFTLFDEPAGRSAGGDGRGEAEGRAEPGRQADDGAARPEEGQGRGT